MALTHQMATNLKVGKKYKIYWGKSNINNAVIHVRALVDHEYVVYKKWLKHKQRWVYAVEHIGWFEYIKDKVTEIQ